MVNQSHWPLVDMLCFYDVIVIVFLGRLRGKGSWLYIITLSSCGIVLYFLFENSKQDIGPVSFD